MGIYCVKGAPMNIIPFLICFPFAAALLVFFIRSRVLRSLIVPVFVLAIMAMDAVLVCDFLFEKSSANGEYFVHTHEIDIVMLVCELLLVILVTVLCIKHKKYPVIALSVISTGIVAACELLELNKAEKAHMLVDRLSIMMCIIIGLIGGLIIIYALGYMKGYHEHHKEYEDRTHYFISLLFVFLGAMFGLVLSENLVWIFFFWEITSICSFLLIGYTKTEEAINNSFRALWMNLLGGLGFSLAILFAAVEFNDFSLNNLVSNGDTAMIAVMLLVFAAMTKSAQFPFSRWLLGAMAAPTPSSALLHSATMVKAGCYMLLRLSPALTDTAAGVFTSLLGGFTFFLASLLAISQSDGKKVLAYSTISNLGLIVTCAGVGTPGAIWAGMFLMIFHAVTKSMLFQCVGAIENSSHSRDIEDMAGLILRLRRLAEIMILGIIGMYLAPFGMLIFKWAALKAFVDAGKYNIFLVILIAFGSSTTLYYWTKWLCKLVSYNSECTPREDKTTFGQYLSMYIHALLVLILCMSFSFLSDNFIELYIEDLYATSIDFLSVGNRILMIILVVLLFMVPLFTYLYDRMIKRKTVPAYISGVNRQGGRAFQSAYGDDRHLELANFYMEDLFGEKKLLKPGIIIGAVILISGLAVTLIQTFL